MLMRPTLATLAAILLSLIASSPANAQLQRLKLNNGGAEKSLEPWVVIAGDWHQQSRRWRGVSAAEGKGFFRGSDGQIEQTLLLPGQRGERRILVGAQLRGVSGLGRIRMRAEALRESGGVSASAVSDDVIERVWFEQQLLLDLPSDARSLRIVIQVEGEGDAGFVGAVDDIHASLIVTRQGAPSTTLRSFGDELLANPGAEEKPKAEDETKGADKGKPKDDELDDVKVESWTMKGAWTSSASTKKRKLKPQEGKRIFLAPSEGKGALEQKVSLPQTKPGVAHRELVLRGSWLAEKPAQLRAWLIFEDKSGKRLKQQESQAQPTTTWAPFELRLPIPKRARQVRLRIQSLSALGKKAPRLDALNLRVLGFSGPHKRSELGQSMESFHWGGLGYRALQELMHGIAAYGQSEAADFLEARITGGGEARIKGYAISALSLRDPKRLRTLFDEMLTGTRVGLRRPLLEVAPRIDPDWRKRLLAYAQDPKADSALRSLIFSRIARDEGSSFFSTIKKTFDASTESGKVALLKVMLRHYPLAKLRRSVLNRALKKSSEESRLRHEALAALVQAKEKRFFTALRPLVGIKNEPEWQRALWVQWCCDFKTVSGLEVAIDIVRSGGIGEERALMRVAPRLTGEAFARWFRGPGARHKDKRVRLATIAWFKRHAVADDLGTLLLLTRAKESDVTLAAIEQCTRFPSEATSDRLNEMLQHRDPLVAAEALQRGFQYHHASEEMLALCRRFATRSFSWPLRVSAIDLLARHGGKAYRPIYTSNLANPRRQVRAAAYEAFTHLREKESVDALIARLSHEEGITLHFLAGCLYNLTGFDWGLKKDRWVSWWERSREKFAIPPRPKGRPQPVAGAGYARYYGLSVQTRRVVFVVDTSGSMGAKSGEKTRLEHAQDQLVKLIDSFDRSVRFLIIAFGDEPYTYADKLSPATRREKAFATERVRELYPEGGTNVYDSLMQAFDIDGVESIFLLSDGQPSVGRIVSGREIIADIKGRNKFLRLRVNTISIGGSPAQNAFMRELAAQNYGDFVPVDG